jgi:hypothetical protein
MLPGTTAIAKAERISPRYGALPCGLFLLFTTGLPYRWIVRVPCVLRCRSA